MISAQKTLTFVYKGKITSKKSQKNYFSVAASSHVALRRYWSTIILITFKLLLPVPLAKLERQEREQKSLLWHTPICLSGPSSSSSPSLSSSSPSSKSSSCFDTYPFVWVDHHHHHHHHHPHHRHRHCHCHQHCHNFFTNIIIVDVVIVHLSLDHISRTFQWYGRSFQMYLNVLNPKDILLWINLKFWYDTHNSIKTI